MAFNIADSIEDGLRFMRENQYTGVTMRIHHYSPIGARYIVGDNRTGIQLPNWREISDDTLVKISNAFALYNTDMLIGYWEQDNGTLHIDSIVFEDDLEIALNLARHHGEICIFDIVAGEVIYL